MSFMLGAFTNGLFSGMRSMDAIQSEWESLKQQRMADEAGDIALKNITKKQDTTLPPVTDLNGAGEWSKREAAAPQWSDAERDKMPVPNYLRNAAKAIYNPGERDRERQAYNMAAETPSSPREGKPYGAPPPEDNSAFGTSTNMVPPTQFFPGLSQPGAPAAAIPSAQGAPQQPVVQPRTTAPVYLPSAQPTQQSNPNQYIEPPPAVGPQSALPYGSGAPTLASSTAMPYGGALYAAMARRGGGLANG